MADGCSKYIHVNQRASRFLPHNEKKFWMQEIVEILLIHPSEDHTVPSAFFSAEIKT